MSFTRPKRPARHKPTRRVKRHFHGDFYAPESHALPLDGRMARATHGLPELLSCPRQITLEVSPQAKKLLEQLCDTGLFGRTIENVAEELLREQLRKVLAMGAHKMGANAK